MKILHISSARIDYPGGTEKIIKELSVRQAKRHKVVILQTNLYEEERLFDRIEERENIKIITAKNDLFLGGFGYSREFKKILKIIWKEFDIVHIHGHGRFTSNYSLKFLKNKKPIIYSGQGFFHDKKNNFFKKIYDKIYGKRLNNATFLTALTKLEINKIKNYGIDEEKIIIIPGGVDFEKISSVKESGKLRKKYLDSKKEKILLYVGRIHESKGIQYVLEAIEDIKIKFFIVGKDAGYKERLKEIIEKKRLKNKVRFFGEVDNEKLIELYNISDIFVLYSNWEGFGLVIIEAMAGGTPCIVSNKGSLPHLVENNYNGFVVNDILELKQRILELTQDKDLRNILSRNSKEFAKKFGWDEIAKKYERLYLEALKYE